MTNDEKKFLESFKEGEYVQVTLLVRNSDLAVFIEHLKKANLNMAVIPSAQQKIDFETDNSGHGNN